jgi:hypothetical protein
MSKDITTKSPSGRVKRTPFAQRSVLKIQEKDPSRVYRIVNNTDDRIEYFTELGYRIEPKQSKIGDNRVENPSALGTANEISVGGGKKAYLMSIDKDWYEEDQAAKQREVDATALKLKQQGKNASDYGNLE